MSVPKYGVLKGTAVDARREDDLDSPHYQVHVKADADYRIAINVRSQGNKPEVMYLVDDAFQHPVTTSLRELPSGYTRLDPRPGGMALDFIRGNLFNKNDMRILPHSLPGPDNDLSDKIETYIARARREPGAMVYAFGSRWGEEAAPDKIFGFEPGNGIHNIHMNQGNNAEYASQDGIYQDGALLIYFPSLNQWVGIFLAFQSQSWHTDDQTGHTISGPVLTEQALRIVAAMVNPKGPAPEREWVTLFNASPEDLSLEGWQIADRLKNKLTLAGVIKSGGMMRVDLPQTVQLGNKGGVITLLDQKGLKVDGVSYTETQAQKEGWAVVF